MIDKGSEKFRAEGLTMDHVCCVTGANGFLASHIVKQLLEEGYRVRGTVRNKDDQRKTAHLQAFPHASQRLELFNADLMKEGSFDEAFDGCHTILHVAMPVVMTAKDPMRDIVDPALKGLHIVVDAVRRNTHSIRKFVYTSSLETIGDVEAARKGETFTENDWNESADMSSPYSYAKVAAERAVIAAFADIKELRKVRLVRLLPGWIAGPLLNGNANPPVSLEPFRALGSGEYPFCPRINVQVVDVRDCARAHVLAVQRDFSNSSNRIPIASNVILSMKEMCRLSAKSFPEIPWASITMPDFILYIASLWDPRLSYGFLRDNLGVIYRVDNSASERILGMKYRPTNETCRDAVASLLEHDLFPRKYSRINFMLFAVLFILVVVYLVLLKGN